jgi:hypothetical protein
MLDKTTSWDKMHRGCGTKHRDEGAMDDNLKVIEYAIQSDRLGTRNRSNEWGKAKT